MKLSSVAIATTMALSGLCAPSNANQIDASETLSDSKPRPKDIYSIETLNLPRNGSANEGMVNNADAQDETGKNGVIQERLNKAIKHSRSFIFKGTFDFIGFESEMDDIKKSLNLLDKQVNALADKAELCMSLNFAKHIFKTMSNSIQSLKHYNESRAPGHRWVYRMIELNVILLAMHDSFGNLDLSIKRYENRIFHFWRNVHVWGQSFRKVREVSPDMRLAYEEQSFEAEKTLATLAGQFPNDQEPWLF
ncbi:hypothetical protein OY671_004445 [Metschnikowia pulcherrima]|nr:hypothetical protein OY671_004445 [Metschnikowia pulcherrima]